MDEITTTTTGVNDAAAAGQLNTDQQNQPIQTADSGATQTQAAAAGGDERVEQAFSKRLSAEREKIEREYSTYRRFIEAEAARYGLTPEQYIQTIEQQRQEQERQQLLAQGINPDTLERVIDQHPAVQQARQFIQQQQRESLKDKPLYTQVEQEIDQLMRETPGLDALTAYHYLLGQKIASGGIEALLASAKSQGEQEAIQKLSKNATTTPGALGGDAPEHKFGYTSLSAEERRKFRERVKRGEITSFENV